MLGDVLHLECDMPETHNVFIPGNSLVFAVVIKQLQAGTPGEAKIGDVKLTTIHGLQLLKAQEVGIEMNGFLDIGYVDGNVIDLIDLQRGISIPPTRYCSDIPTTSLPAG